MDQTAHQIEAIVRQKKTEILQQMKKRSEVTQTLRAG